MRHKRREIGLADIFHFSFEALWDRKVRSGLTILMVVMGASLVTSLNGMTQGMDAFMKSQLSTLATNVLFVLPAPRQLQMAGPPPAPQMVMNDQTVQVIRSIKGVQMAFPAYRAAVTVSSGSQSRQAFLFGVDIEKLVYVNPDLSLSEGSFYSRIDTNGIVFGNKVAYPPGQPNPLVRVGQIVSLEYTHVEKSGVQEKVVTERRSFQVKGILNEVGSEWRDNAVYISVPAANAFLRKAGKYDVVYTVTTDTSVNEEVQQALINRFGVTNVGVITPKDIAERVESIQGGFRFFMTVVAIISLIVGSMGIVTTMFTSVIERTREIGILKALGSTNKVVLLFFLLESAAIGILGAIAGMSMGVAASNFLVQRLPLQDIRFFRAAGAVFTPFDFIYVFALAVGMSMLAGLYPAWRAAKMDPVDALRG